MSATNTPVDPRIGAVLDNRYRILSRIASGSMGVIYRGERLKLGRRVAIKILQTPFANNQGFINQFETEARALSRLSHPNCVSIVDFGVADAPYLVMDLVHGKTLKDLIERRALPAPRALHITRQVLAALAHAHGHGIVHRDVKPGNIMLTEATGAGDHIRILDFGLAKLRDTAMSANHSGAAKVVGTPVYMSPEQARGASADLRSDIYSVGVVLFEMLTGHKPFQAEDMFEVLHMQQHKAPPTFGELAPDAKLSHALELVVHKAMAKHPDKRFQSALEFASAIDDTPEAALPQTRMFSSPSFASGVGPGSTASSMESLLSASVKKGGRPLGLLLVLLALAACGYLVWTLVLRPARNGAPQADGQAVDISRGGTGKTPGPGAPKTQPIEGRGSAEEQAAHNDAVPDGLKAARTEAAADRSARAADLATQADGEPREASTTETSGTTSVAAPGKPAPASAATEGLAPKVAPARKPAPASGVTGEPAPPTVVNRKPGPSGAVASKPVPTAAPASKAAPSTSAERLASVRAHLHAGRREEAIKELLVMCSLYPSVPYYAYLLGHQYFVKRWASEGFKYYRKAIAVDRSYAQRRNLILDAIEALDGKATGGNASAFLANSVGRAALPYLRRAVKTHPSKAVRAQVARLLPRIQ